MLNYFVSHVLLFPFSKRNWPSQAIILQHEIIWQRYIHKLLYYYCCVVFGKIHQRLQAFHHHRSDMCLWLFKFIVLQNVEQTKMSVLRGFSISVPPCTLEWRSLLCDDSWGRHRRQCCFVAAVQSSSIALTRAESSLGWPPRLGKISHAPHFIKRCEGLWLPFKMLWQPSPIIHK